MGMGWPLPDSRSVLFCGLGMGGEGWLQDPDGYWVKRFHRDEASWRGGPRVFVDDGRGMPHGEPALLKRRQHLRREQAEQLWKALLREGWRPTKPVWGPACKP